MKILLGLIVLFLLFGLTFLYLKLKHPQTIWLGITFLGSLFHLGLILVVVLVQRNLSTPLVVLAMLFLIPMLFMPTLMIATFLMNGIRLIRHEGFSFKNSLSLILGIGLIVYLIFWPAVVDVTENNILNAIYQFISFSTVYLSFILIFYTVSNLLNLIHFKKEDIDYFIVLGAHLDGDKVTPLLAGRINRALDIQKAQNKGKLVFSGGQGADELVPEGEAMAQYALDQGTNSKFVLKEVESVSTYENIKFSKEVIDRDWAAAKEPNIAIVTNNYHLIRGLMHARNLGINAIGYGSKSKFYYSLNAFLREFVAYLQMTYKVHSTFIGLAGLFIFGLYILAYLLV